VKRTQISRREKALFPAELGERLRQLRGRAGLSQEAVALLCGLGGPGGKSWVCSVERGYLKSGPSLVRLLDFLRACGGGVADIRDVLDRHTAEWREREEQTLEAVAEALKHMPSKYRRRGFYYAVGLRFKHKWAVRTAAEQRRRVEQTTRRARSEYVEWHLRQVFNRELGALRLATSHSLGIELRAYGRLVFATLRRLRRSRPVWREKAMTRLDEWPVRLRLEPEPFRRMKAAVIELFEKLAQSGGLD